MAGCSGYTEPALHVTATSAQLNAQGDCSNAGGHHCYYYCRWGKNGRFTHRTAVLGPVGKTHGRRQIKITLKGLAPDSTYQYQLCGKGDGVKVYRCVGPNGKTSSSSHFTTNRMLWGFAAMGNQFSSNDSSEGPPWDMDAVSRFESTDAGGQGGERDRLGLTVLLRRLVRRVLRLHNVDLSDRSRVRRDPVHLVEQRPARRYGWCAGVHRCRYRGGPPRTATSPNGPGPPRGGDIRSSSGSIGR